MSTKAITCSLLTALSILTAGCGDVSQGASPSIVTIMALEAASGATPDQLGQFLLSDATTIVKNGDVDVATIFDDPGEVTMALTLKNPGAGGAGPSALNVVTFSHYHVTYRRTDGHNIEGVDVPYSFDSGLTFSVPTNGTAQAGFEIVRHSAKEEAPIRALAASGNIISTVAEVTFYGKDQVGNNVAVTGSIGINFGNFADPTS